MSRKATPFLVLLVLGAAAAAGAGAPWKEKPLTEWTFEELFKITQDSPWAQTVFLPKAGTRRRQVVRDASSPPIVVPIRTPQGGVVGYKTVDRPRVEISQEVEPVGVEWASSLTMRAARVRIEQLHGYIDEEEAAEQLETPPEEYAIAVRGAPVLFLAEAFEEKGDEALRQSAYLKPKRSKQKIAPERVELNTSGDPGSLFSGEPVVWFYFPRESAGTPFIGPDESKVDFHWVVPGNEINVTFDLRKMMRDGKPDL